ncbi:MAG: MmcQ/YjbR family DNA-binding protein [Candidatus Acidiferrales bacterium]
MTPSVFRKLALSLPDTEEREHMKHPDFRVHGKIFATLAYPSKEFGMVSLWPEQQAAMVKAHPKMFSVIPGGWGKKGATRVHLKAATERAVAKTLADAWEKHAPKPKKSSRSKSK